MRCTYSINSRKKHSVFMTEHLAISCQGTWFLNLVLGNIIMEKEDRDHPTSTHSSSTRVLLMRIGTRRTTLHGFGWLKERSDMTQPIIQKTLACSPRRKYIYL
jgi:hypothetical protein